MKYLLKNIIENCIKKIKKRFSEVNLCKKISKIAYAYVIKTFSGICVAVLFLLSEFTYGQAVGDYGTRYNTGASTSWSTASNWVVCVTAGTWAGATVAGTVPANTKNVWILSGANYNMDAASGECLDLIVIGTLYNNIASKNIDIAGNLDVQGSFDWSGASTSSITVNGTFTMSGGTFSCGNSDLTLNSTVTYTSGTFTVGTNTVTYGSAGAQDIIPITYYNLSRTNGGTASLTGNTIITGNLNLNSGLILLGAYNLTLSQVSSTVTGSPSSSAMVVTDGAGLLYKNIGTSMPYSFIYPIGDNTGPNYTPVTLNFTAFSSATVNIGAQVVNVADPNLNGTETDYLKRYWTFKKSTGTLTSYTCTADFQYVSPTDVFGNENNIRASIWDNSSWTDLTLSSQSSINTGTKTLSIKYPIDRNGIQLINNHFTGRHVSPLNYYKTVASGDWKDSTIWNVSTDMITWSPTLEYPNDLNSLGIDICSGHTVTVSGDISVDRVDSVNGTLVINSGVKFNLSNNVNPDMILAGTIDNKGDINSIGTINVLAGGTYIHDRDGGVIPSATWDPASNCNVNSTTTSATGLNQTFGNFTYSSANTLALDGNMGVAGNMVINAGTVNQGNYNITLSGSLSGGGTLTQGTGTMTIGGDNTITTYNSGNGKMDYNGITQKVKGCTYNKLSISGSGSKTLQGNATVNAKFTLNGGTSFKCSTYNITFKDTTTGTGTFFPGTGAANFVTYSSASIQTVFKGTYNVLNKSGTGTASLNGITTVKGTFAQTGGTFACGNYNITFNGKVSSTGTFTNGNNIVTYGGAFNLFQKVISATYHNLYINKTSSVPISISGNVTVDDSLYMQMGMLCLGNYDLTLSQTTADIYFTNGSADTLTKIVTDGAGKGYLYKQFPSGLSLPAYTFPIAGSTNTSDYSPATITFASNTTAGLVGARVTNSADLQLATDYLKKYWSFKTSGLTTYSYTADFKYSASDIVGTESNYKVCQFNTSKGWVEHTSESAVNTGTHDLQLTVALTNVNDSLNKSDFTGGKCPSLYFETTVSGNWSDPSIWEISTDSTFQSSTTVNYSPNSINSAGIYVHDTLKVDYNLAIDQTVVNGGGHINILNGKTLTINDGAGTDLDVQEGSSVDNAGTINNAGQIKVENDAYYIHDQNGGTVPSANWGVNSTCKIKSAGTAPAGLIGQNFGNFEYDSIGRTLNLAGDLSIQKDLILTNGVLNASSYTINVIGSITGTGDLSFTSGVLNIWSNYTNTGAFNCTTCTVNYNSNDNYQYLKGTPNYYRLNIKGSNNKGIYGDIKVNGPFNVYAGNSFYCQNAQNPPIAQNVTFNDSVTYNGTLFYTDTNTVTYGSTSINQNVIPVTYYNLVKTGAGGTASLTAAIEVQNKFNIISGIFKCNNFDLTLDGDASNTGTFIPGNNTVTYAGAVNQTVIPVKYYNLTKTNIGKAIISTGNLVVNKNLYIENSSTLCLGTSINDTVYGTTTIIGTLAFGGASVNSLVLQDSLKGGAKSVLDMTQGAHYLKLNGAINTIGLLKTDGVCSTVEYSRSTAPSDQLIIASPNYRNLIISGTGKKTLGGNTTVGCILTLSNNLYVNVYNVTIGSAGSVISGTGTFDKNHMVVTDSTGCFIKNGTTQSNYITTYPVGTSKTGGPYYSPLIVKKMTATIAGTVGLSVCARPFMHPNVYTNHSGMTRYWKVDTIGSGMSNVNADLYFIFPPADYHAGKGEIPGYWDGEYFVHPVNPGFSAAAAADTFYTKGTCILYGDWTQLNFRNYYYTYYPGGVVAPGTSDWNTASTWTLDNTGRNLYGSAIPGPSDSVVILSQRTVTVSSNINTASLSVAINSGGILNLGSNYFTSGLSTFCGQGTLRTSINSFPTVNILNTFCGTTGGTVEYYWTGSALMPSVQTYYNLVLNLDQTASVANIMHNLTVYNNFTVQRGTFMICKDTAAGANPATDQRLVIDVQGNVEVSSNGAITTGNRRTNTNRLPGAFGGTPPYSTCANLPNAGYDGGSSVPYFYDIYHKFYCGGSFKNNGTVKFISDQITLPNYTTLTPEAAVTLRFYGYSHDTLICNGITDLYNLIVDKGPDQTYNLTVNPIAYTNFRIFGMNACAGNDKNYTDKGNPEIDRAIWIKNGTLRLTGNTVIPSLSEGNGGAGPRGGSNLPRSDFFIPRNGCLLLDGPNVIVLVTADEYREVNVAFGFAPGANSDAIYGVRESNGSSLSLYGKFQINSGYISTRESDGIQFWPNASGYFEADGGIVDAKQLCDGNKNASDISNVIINGGTIHLRGGYRRDKTSFSVNTINDIVNKPILYDNNFYNKSFLMTGNGTFDVDQYNDLFTMSGGEVHVYDICNNTASQRAIEINCDPQNTQISGGSFNIHTNRPGKTYLISNTSPFPNLNIIKGINQDNSTFVEFSDCNSTKISSGKGYGQAPYTHIILDSMTISGAIFYTQSFDLQVNGNFKIKNLGSYYTNGTNNTIINGSTINFDNSFNTAFNNLRIGRIGNVNITGSNTNIPIGGDFTVGSGTNLNVGVDTLTIATNVSDSGYCRGSGQILMGSGILEGLSTPSVTNLTVPTVTINDGGTGGSGFAGYAIIAPDQSNPGKGKVIDFVITSQGSAYNTAPIITFAGGGGTTQATATANLTGERVTSVTITNPGVGYTLPTVSLTAAPAGGINAIAKPIIRTNSTGANGILWGLIIVNPGSGYAATPTLNINGVSYGTGNCTITPLNADTISGDGNGIFTNLLIHNINGLAGSVQTTTTSNISVKGTFKLNADRLFNIENLNLYMDTNAIFSAGTGTWGINRFIRTKGLQSDFGITRVFSNTSKYFYPFGTVSGAVNKYTPDTIWFGSAPATWGTITVNPVNSGNTFLTTANKLAYYWKVASYGFTGTNGIAINKSFIYPNNPVVYNAAWEPVYFVPSVWNLGGVPADIYHDANIINLHFWKNPGIIDGFYTCGDAVNQIITYYSVTNGAWNNGNTWSTTSVGGPVAGTVPGPSNPVIIGDATHNHTITVPVASQCGSLFVNSGSTLDMGTVTGSNFGMISNIVGQGKIRISSSAATADFPGGDFNAFILCGGGEVEYYTTGATDFKIPTTSNSNMPLKNYNNLTISPNSGRYILMPNVSLNICRDLTIKGASSTAIVRLNSAGAQTLTVGRNININGGALRFMRTGNGNQTVIVNSDINIASGAMFDMDGTNGNTNTMTINGNLFNNGKFEMDSGSVCNVAFKGVNNASISGSGYKTDFNLLTIDKGSSMSSILRVNMPASVNAFSISGTPPALTLTNGTFRLISNQSLTLSTNSSFTIPQTTCLSDSGNGSMYLCTGASNNYDMLLYGKLEAFGNSKVIIGTPTNTNNNDIQISLNTDASIDVRDNATLYVNGQIRRSISSLSGHLIYNQSGTSNVCIAGNKASTSRGMLEILNQGSVFSMSGGNLTFLQGGSLLFQDVYIRPDSVASITGGTINLASGIGPMTASTVNGNSTVTLTTGNTSALCYGMFVVGVSGIPASSYITNIIDATHFKMNNNANATVASVSLTFVNNGGAQSFTINSGSNLWNLNISGTSSNVNTTDLKVNNLILNGSLTISGNSTFNTNNFDISVAGNFSNSGTYNAGTNNTTLFDGNAQTGTFNSLTNFYKFTVNKTPGSKVTFAGGLNNFVVNNYFYLNSGILDDGGININTFGDSIYNYDTHQSTGTGRFVFGKTTRQIVACNNIGKFGNIEVNNSGGLTSVSNMTINGVLTFTNGCLTIGNTKLTMNDTVDANPVVGALGVSPWRYIICSGNSNDSGGVIKQYKYGAHNFAFPLGVKVGVQNKYTPVYINVTSNKGVGTIYVRPVHSKHLSTKDAADKQLNYYWTISTTGFNNPTVTDSMIYDKSDVTGNELNYREGRFATPPVVGDWKPYGGIIYDTLQNGGVKPYKKAIDNSRHKIVNTGVHFIDGDYTAGEISEFFPNLKFWSRVRRGNWDDPNSWSNIAFNGVASTTYPMGQPVCIQVTDTIVMTSGDQNSFNLLINGVLDLDTTRGNNLGDVTGTGILKLKPADINGVKSFVLPNANLNGFGFYGSSSYQGNPVRSGGTGGTIEYNNNTSSAINLSVANNDTISTYFNLTIASTGTGDVNFVNTTSSDLYINGDLNIKSGIFRNNSSGISNIYCHGNLILNSGGIMDNKSSQFNLDSNLINYSGINAFLSTSNLNLIGNNPQTIGGATPTTVEYLNIYNGIKNLTDTLIVNKNFTLSNSTAQFNDNGNVLYVKGTFTNNSQITAFNSTGTTIFDFSGAQNINGTKLSKFNNMIIRGGTKTYATSPATDLTIKGYLLLDNTGGNGVINIGDKNINIYGNWINNSNANALTATNFSTTSFLGTNQYILGSYNTIFNYIAFNSGVAGSSDTIVANITVNKDITFNKGNVVSKNQSITVKGNWLNNVSPTVFKSVFSTDTVILNGSVNSYIGGKYPTTFNNLYIYNATRTLSDTTSVGGSDLNITKNFIIGTNSQIIYNNKTIVHYGDLINNSGTTALRSVTNNGTYIFKGTTVQTIKGTNQTTFNNLTIDGGSVKTIKRKTSVANLLTFVSGIINTDTTEIDVTKASPAAITGYSNNAYIVGKLRRNIVSTGDNGSYDFPVGTSAYYERLNLKFNSLKGTSNILCYFNTPLTGQKPFVNPFYVNNTFIDSLLDGGYWTLIPNVEPNKIPGSFYKVTLYETGYTNAPVDPKQMSVIKRENSSSAWVYEGYHDNATQSITGGIAIAVSDSLIQFCDEAIGFNHNTELPISLLKFTAKPKNNYVVELNWITVSEVNNDYFTIERSKDAIHFEKVLVKKGARNSDSEIKYKEYDEMPFSGQSYYRLKQTDIDANFKYSEIVVVNINKKGDNNSIEFNVYPNPNNGKSFYTKLSGLKPNFRVDVNITDIYGNTIESNSIYTNGEGNYLGLTIPDTELSKGIYFVSCEQNEKKIVKKMIVE